RGERAGPGTDARTPGRRALERPRRVSATHQGTRRSGIFPWPARLRSRPPPANPSRNYLDSGSPSPNGGPSPRFRGRKSGCPFAADIKRLLYAPAEALLRRADTFAASRAGRLRDDDGRFSAHGRLTLRRPPTSRGGVMSRRSQGVDAKDAKKE